MQIIIYNCETRKVTTIDREKITEALLNMAAPTAMILLTTQGVYADTGIKQAMKPLIQALQDLAEPVSYAFMIYGGIKYMSGHSSEGQKTIKEAIGGYVLIQWIPWIFGIIRGIGAGK
jgi:hypothetical protein